MTTPVAGTERPLASAAGRFSIGNELTVNRLGFGAMRITGKGVWGEPPDAGEAKGVLVRAVELGVNFIDTADSYGPHVSERLICEALHPYDGLLVATKGGLERPGPESWRPRGDPEYLRSCVEGSRERLQIDTIDLWQLHRIDPKVPRDEQFAVIREMIDESLIRHVGLSECTVQDIEAARKVFPVATVQNLYNLGSRGSEDVLDHCEAEGVGFIPWYPLAAGKLTGPGSRLSDIAKRHGATEGQVAIAWLLARSPVMLPIPGTGKVAHLEENMRGAAVKLTDEDIEALNGLAKA